MLQHASCEPPGVFEEMLLAGGHELERVELDEGEPLPDWRQFDAIIAMGGPMSVNDVDEHPWLRDELRQIGDAVRSGLPYWGVCLGVQLLAAALGASVHAGPEPEVGVLGVELTPSAREDPVFGGLPDTIAALQWHGDTFDLPDGAVLLASSPAYPHQAFRWGDAAYGVQFHVEAGRELTAGWFALPEYAASLEQAAGPTGVRDLSAAIADGEQQMATVAGQMFERWLELAQTRRDARASAAS